MSASRAIGVDLGGTKILAGVLDRAGTVHRQHTRPTPVSSQDELLAALDDVVEDLLGEDVGAIGFGIPSQIDQRPGRAVSSVHVPLQDLDFPTAWPTVSPTSGDDNDGNAARPGGSWRGARGVQLVS